MSISQQLPFELLGLDSRAPTEIVNFTGETKKDSAKKRNAQDLTMSTSKLGCLDSNRMSPTEPQHRAIKKIDWYTVNEGNYQTPSGFILGTQSSVARSGCQDREN